MAKEITNTAASVHARLLSYAHARSRSFNELLLLYAMERFLHRLSQTKHAKHFVLKGALLMRAWDTTMYRTTRDIDLLARMSNEVTVLEGVLREACVAEVNPDGLAFDAKSVRGETIVEEADYPGVRVTFGGRLGNARLDMQIDIGFGDTITPAPQELDFPTLLPMPGTRMLAYPPETVIAEKFQVMLFRAEANSRLKDFHDVWWIARHFAFDGDQLAAAIRTTCAKRGTEIPAEPVALTTQFGSIAAKRAQWRVFRQRVGNTNSPEEFEVVVRELRDFLTPVLASIRSGQSTDLRWDPVRGWTGS